MAVSARLRLVLRDRQGRPRVLVEAFLRQGGAIGLSLRVLDREGAPRLVGALLVREDGTGELALVVLDRRGTARAASAFFLCEDGALVLFMGVDRAGVRRLVVFTIGRPAAVPALPSAAADMREVFGIGVHERPRPIRPLRAAGLALPRRDDSPNRGGGGLLPGVELVIDGQLLRFLDPLLNAAVVSLDGSPRLPLIGAALVVHDGLPLFLSLAAVEVGNGGIHLLPLPPAALGADGLLVFLSAAADVLVGAVFAHWDGMGELAVVVLDRRGTARVASAFFLRVDGALVGFDRAGVRRFVVITIGRPAAVPALPSAADMREVFGIGVHERPRPIRPLRAAGLALPRRDDNPNRGGGGGLLPGAALTLAGWLLRAAAAGFVGPRLLPPVPAAAPYLPLPTAAPGVDEMLGFLTAPADGLDWRRRFRLIDAALAGLGDGAPPRLPIIDAAELGLDFEGLGAAPLLAPAAFGLDRPLLLPPAGPPLGPPAAPAMPPPPLIPAAAGNGAFLATPNPTDDDTLQRLEEGRLVGPREGAATLQAMVSHLMAEMQRENVDESRVTDATATLITELLSRMSERARYHIISSQALPMDHPPQQQNNHGRMWRSFFYTVGLSVTSNMIMYLLSLGVGKLDHSEEGSRLNAEQQKYAWVVKFIAWMAEKIAAPVVLSSLVIWVRENTIDNEMHLMQYDNNGRANFLINGLSRGLFFAIRRFPGISQPDLWARLASVFIDVIGACFLCWMRGFWDPDIPDAT